MKANLPNARPNPIRCRLSRLHYAFTFVVVGLSTPDALAQPRGPVDRVEKTAKDLEVVEMRTRVVTNEGALVVYDAPRGEGELREQPGYLAYWKGVAGDDVYVYGRVMKKRSDLVHALLWLRHDFGIDPHDLAPDVFTDDLPDPPEVNSTDLPASRAWFLATRDRVMEIVGLWQGDDYHSDVPPDVTAYLAPPCVPCWAAAAAGGEDWIDVDPTGDVYAAAVIAACGCCFIPVCPPNCNDNNACTRDYCEVGCGTAYCVHESRNCSDGMRCTDDSCNPSTGGCEHRVRYCNDGLSCTYDSCDPSTGGCTHTSICPGGTCCHGAQGAFCCWNGDSCCANPDHCCPAGTTCCDGGCCTSGYSCCDGQTCCPGGWNCRNGQCCEGPWCEATCCGVQDACCGAGCCSLESPQCCNAQLGLCCDADDLCCVEACCSADSTCCGNRCCDAAHHCCADGVTCCEVGQECCDGQCCPVDFHCCGDPGVCCLPGGTCCNGACCDGPCCEATGECCPAGGSCCNNECCAGPCCGGVCCPGGPLCCGDACCAEGQSCCGGRTCCDPSLCCGNGECCAQACEGCLDNGTLSGGIITVYPATAVCLGDLILFILTGEQDTGGMKRVDCSAKMPIDSVEPQYTWTITKPDGTTLGGSGPVAAVVADIPGTHSCTFTATANRECPPASREVEPATVVVTAGATLSVDPSSIPAHTAWPSMPDYSYSEVTVQWDPPDCEGRLEIVGVEPTGGYQPPNQGTLNCINANLWRYDAFDEPQSALCPEIKTVWIAAFQDELELGRASVLVHPVHTWWTTGHKHGPGGQTHPPDTSDFTNDYNFLRWKYATVLATTGGAFAGPPTIGPDTCVPCPWPFGCVYACTTCIPLMGCSVNFGTSTFASPENQAASIIGHELVHATGANECPAYRWEAEHCDGTKVCPCDGAYLQTVLDYLRDHTCP